MSTDPSKKTVAHVLCKVNENEKKKVFVAWGSGHSLVNGCMCSPPVNCCAVKISAKQ